MSPGNLSRRDFIGKTTAGIAGAAVVTGALSAGTSSCQRRKGRLPDSEKYSAEAFASIVEKNLPSEDLYDYHRRLSNDPVHIPRRDNKTSPAEGEMALPDQGWKLIWNSQSSVIIRNAVLDFQDYLFSSQNVKVTTEETSSLDGWQNASKVIVVGTRSELKGCGSTLETPKSYEINISPDRIVVCGYDERGAMFGLYNLEARMNLREAPFLITNQHIVRQSLYDTRMILSWMGWMEWPDNLLSHLVHDGYDGIFASVYANPNGDRSTAENSTDTYARLMYKIRRQDPVRVRDLINRAARFGIKVYTPIIYQYLGTRESEAGLRTLVRDIVRKFPDIQGYILVTEGFWYKSWGGGHGADKAYMQDWAQNWCRAVGIVEEECHRINPDIEILPWEYNIDFRPQNSDVKRYFIRSLPSGTIPLLTWENGKSFEIDGMKGYLRDYSISQAGPAEVTEAQIEEARMRKMKVYCKADAFATWQFGTVPYLPCPHQWYKRSKALEKYGVNGTLESWSTGYKPNFISELRAWTCWSNEPSMEELFEAVAAQIFGKGNEELVINAWEHFSEAIQLVPDTGPNMGTNNSVGNPLFFREPPARTLTYNYSWTDFSLWQQCCFGSSINPYWPFTNTRMVFFPDFTNRTNKAESYAREATGIQFDMDKNFLPLFLKYMKQAAEKMEQGLKLYRRAAMTCPESKRTKAVREVVVAEQIQRMMQSDCAILEFEDLRLKQAVEEDLHRRDELLNKMESIVSDEIIRTELTLCAAGKDSRLGFQFEQDYVYTPYSLNEKLKVLKETLNVHIPDARRG